MGGGALAAILVILAGLAAMPFGGGGGGMMRRGGGSGRNAASHGERHQQHRESGKDPDQAVGQHGLEIGAARRTCNARPFQAIALIFLG